MIQSGRADQLSVHALSVPDVIDLLPVGAFVDSARTWRELRELYARERTDLDFKNWVRTRCGGRISVGTIKKAIAAMDEIPEDLSTLAVMLEDHVRR